MFIGIYKGCGFFGISLLKLEPEKRNDSQDVF